VNITAEFVKSAAGAEDFPRDGLPEIALVGRSNVGKSSLINALTRRRLARASAAPGKTRLANLYRVQRGARPPLYLVDLPGYGYARGGEESAREFDELTRTYFGQDRRERQDRREGKSLPASPALPAPPAFVSALLLVDARHPGLASDRAAWDWLKATGAVVAVVATKIDKLARGERLRAMRQLQSVHEDSVLPVSAVTGEGLDELWKLIDRLANSSKPRLPGPSRGSHKPARATAPPPPTLRPRSGSVPSKVEGPTRARSHRRK
jgi:GTP-binding protein